MMPKRKPGGLMEPRPNQPFSIHSPEAVWFVHSGNVDLFLIDTVNGKPVSARYPLLRVEQGHAIFGICPRNGACVMAVATPGTQLRCLTQDDLRSRTSDSTHGLDSIALVEDWILGLAATSALTAIPKLFSSLEPGNILEVSDNPKPILPVAGIVWVEHLQGSSRFLNLSDIQPIADGVHFPICKNGWLLPAPQSRIRSYARQLGTNLTRSGLGCKRFTTS